MRSIIEFVKDQDPINAIADLETLRGEITSDYTLLELIDEAIKLAENKIDTL